MKKEMNNKGFSLVELIIVIAIMVILVAVLAPQYLRYVEKSRVSTDTQTMVEFINACQVAAADPEAELDTSKTYEVKAKNDGTIEVSGDLQTVLTDKLGLMASTDFSGSNSTSKVQSTAYKTAAPTITLKFDSTAKLWKVITTGIDNSGALNS
ncbi:MAG: prepilin-type N-terminal cleavage/methylation domain-containing protein [Lachnospiraceae bacterium]|nr:prepilin-type N-terminal cleavage/methylation domain-containing protein [Lachnospiraceae bacterium]